MSSGDIITTIDHQMIRNSNDLATYLVAKAPGIHVTITVNRAGKKITMQVILGTLLSQS